MTALRLHGEVTGKRGGPPLLLIHSLGLDHRMWEAQVESLAEDFEVARLDIRGHGRSPAPPGAYTLEGLAEDVLATALALFRGERFHFCGISIGGLIGLWLAKRHADKLLSLTVANSAARIGSEGLWLDRIAKVTTRGMASIADVVESTWFSPASLESSPELADRARAVLMATPPQGYIGCCNALAEADLRSEVEAIDLPTLIVAGERDLAAPPVETEWLHRRIAGSRLRILTGAAHLSNLECPEEFLSVLRSFLDTAEEGFHPSGPPIDPA